MLGLLLILLIGLLLWLVPPLPAPVKEFGRLLVLATLISLVPVLAGAVR